MKVHVRRAQGGRCAELTARDGWQRCIDCRHGRERQGVLSCAVGGRGRFAPACPPREAGVIWISPEEGPTR